MGRAASLLTVRAAAAVAILGALVAYYAARTSLPDLSEGWDRALIVLVLIPAVFGLVLLALPLWRTRHLLLIGLGLAALGIGLEQAGVELAANFVKLAAMTALGFAFLELFESVAWVVLVAVLIPWVDAFSVWTGPTRTIVEEKPDLFTTLSIAFPVPGGRGTANLGLPDVLFFALFLAAAARFHLRVLWTWVAMTASFGVTLILAIVFDVAGLPALPLLCVGFLAPNADLIWRELRERRRAGPTRPSESRREPPPAGAD